MLYKFNSTRHHILMFICARDELIILFEHRLHLLPKFLKATSQSRVRPDGLVVNGWQRRFGYHVGLVKICTAD